MEGGLKELDTARSFKGVQAPFSSNPFPYKSQYGIGAVIVGHKCIVFGGYHQHEQKIGIYDIAKRTWKQHVADNCEHLYSRIRMAFIVHDVLFAYLWSLRTNSCVFVTLDLVSMAEWQQGGYGKCEQMGFGTSGSYVELRNEAVLFGGMLRGTDIVVYNVEKSSWYKPKTRGLPPRARGNHSTCSHGNHVFVLGGAPLSSDTRGNFDSLDLHILTMNINRFTWSTPVVRGSLPPGRYLFQAACTSGQIFVFGGYGGTTRFDTFSLQQNCWRRGYYNERVDESEGFEFRSNWDMGTSDHAMILTPLMIVVFGGFQLPVTRPLHITPL